MRCAGEALDGYRASLPERDGVAWETPVGEPLESGT